MVDAVQHIGMRLQVLSEGRMSMSSASEADVSYVVEHRAKDAGVSLYLVDTGGAGWIITYDKGASLQQQLLH